MKNAAELYAMLEERFSGWSFENTPRPLLLCLSRIPELPKDMEAQARMLSQMVVKCEALSIFRTSLERLTVREHRVVMKPSPESTLQTLTLPPTGTPNDASAITALISEIKRLEGELSSVNVDYLAVLRFIRHNREKIV